MFDSPFDTDEYNFVVQSLKEQFKKTSIFAKTGKHESKKNIVCKNVVT